MCIVSSSNPDLKNRKKPFETHHNCRLLVFKRLWLEHHAAICLFIFLFLLNNSEILTGRQNARIYPNKCRLDSQMFEATKTEIKM